MTTDTPEVAATDMDAMSAAIVERLAGQMSDSMETMIADQVNNTIDELGLRTVERPPRDGDEPVSEWRNAGEFFKAAWLSDMKNVPDARLKVLNEGTGGSGGNLVPEAFVAQLLEIAVGLANFRPLAFVMPMDTLSMRIPAINETSRATNVYGGVQGYWTAESGTITASEPAFTSLMLEAKKLAFYTSSSNEMLADNAVSSLEALLLRLFGRAVTWFEEQAFVRGDGAGEPIGYLNADCKIAVAAEAGQDASTIVAENIDNMVARLLPGSLSNAIWVANIDIMPQIVSMARVVGTGGGPAFMANVAGVPPQMLYGRPVVFSEHASTLGTEGDLSLVDFSYYVIGDRQGLTVDASPHVRFPQDETVWRGVKRLDARPWLQTALTPAQGTNTLSPIITLATRS